MASYSPNPPMACHERALPRESNGGEGGIRTHGPRKGTAVFETARFGRSRTSPFFLKTSAVKLEALTVNHVEIASDDGISAKGAN